MTARIVERTQRNEHSKIILNYFKWNEFEAQHECETNHLTVSAEWKLTTVGDERTSTDRITHAQVIWEVKWRREIMKIKSNEKRMKNSRWARENRCFSFVSSSFNTSQTHSLELLSFVAKNMCENVFEQHNGIQNDDKIQEKKRKIYFRVRAMRVFVFFDVANERKKEKT